MLRKLFKKTVNAIRLNVKVRHHFKYFLGNWTLKENDIRWIRDSHRDDHEEQNILGCYADDSERKLASMFGV
jgi:hypothetical protein